MNETERYLDIAGVRLHCIVAGADGPWLLLLHGFGAGVFSWNDVLPALSERFRVVAFDRPGFGATPRPEPAEEGADPYSHAENVRQALGVLDAVGAPRASIVAHSAGSLVASALALDHADRVGCLVLEDPAVLTLPSETLTRLSQPLRSPLARRVGPAVVHAVGPRVAHRLLRRGFSDPSRLTPERVRDYFRPFEAKRWEIGLWESSTAERDGRLAERLADIAVPTLVLAGDRDRIVPLSDIRRVASAIPRARFALVPECGHVPHEERPKEFLEIVMPFLASAPVEPPAGSPRSARGTSA